MKPPKETIPSLSDQAAKIGATFGFYSFGKAERDDTDFLNPGLVQRPDGLWLLARVAQQDGHSPVGMNDVVAFKLDESGTIPQMGIRLEWPNRVAGQQFEDARGFYVDHMNQVGVSACTFQWFGQSADPAWTGAIQCLGFFDENWQCKVLHYPPFDTNGTELKVVPRESFQKNWIWWKRDGRLHLLYKSAPWIVATFDNSWVDGRMVYIGEPVRWDYGEIRGGTAPVEIDGMLVTFFHSSTPWFDKWRRYHTGAIAFSPEPPFTPLFITPTPLLSGTTHDHWAERKPACIFPCGAVVIGDDILVTSGVNDIKCAWTKINARKLMSLMVPIGAEQQQNNSETSIYEPELIVTPTDAKREAMLERMAKARAGRGTGKPKKRKVKARRKKPLQIEQLNDTANA